MTQMLRIGDELFERLRRAAAATQRPIEEVAAKALAVGLPPNAEDAPSAYHSDLRRLDEAADDTLWAVWHSTIAPAAASRHHDLLERHASSDLTPDERQELDRLRDAADRLLIRRAHAAALLRWRGHAVPING